ncbi:MAG: mannose-1-phosphate guanylyltransferase [Chitinispirillaceae bacterium]|nr:mannose-1-phosphate guanylyltransferase [Chitinispirillaceae bacterium]
MKTIVPVILAGGIGERFWPLSRSGHPKQLLALTSNATLIEETFKRARVFSSRGVTPLVITGKAIARRMKALLSNRWRFDCIVEPVGKNTAPAIALAAAWITAKYGDAIMAVLPADHLIRPLPEFSKAVRFAAALADERGRLVVFGVTPTRPDTGYGYIELGASEGGAGTLHSYAVKRFVEKPDARTAKKYCAAKKYRWNSGVFVWKNSVLLADVERYMPGLYAKVQAAAGKGFSKAAIEEFYRVAEKESIDYGIMERSTRVSAVSARFFWDDIGSWESLCRITPQDQAANALCGHRMFEAECERSLIVNKSPHALAVVGCRDLAVIATHDAVLVIQRSNLPDIKKYLGQMKGSGAFPRELF